MTELTPHEPQMEWHASTEEETTDNAALVDADVREAFQRMWNDGYDGKDLAMSFARVAASVVREENSDDIDELRRQLD